MVNYRKTLIQIGKLEQNFRKLKHAFCELNFKDCVFVLDRSLFSSYCSLLFCIFSLLNESFQELLSLQRALKEFVASADPIYSKQHEDFFVGFVGR